VTSPFDPYHIWLGIPPAEQPADHYRLLGISRFESNLDVIANAADQRIRHIRSMQMGRHQEESQRLLNEIAAATAVLLDTEQRREYDASLAPYSDLMAVSLDPLPPPPLSVPQPAPLAIAPAATTSQTVLPPPREEATPLISQRLLQGFAVVSLTLGIATVVVVAIALANRRSPPSAAQSVTSSPPGSSAPAVPTPQTSPAGTPQHVQPDPFVIRPPMGAPSAAPPPVSMDVAEPIWLNSFEWRSSQTYFPFRSGDHRGFGDFFVISDETKFLGHGATTWLMHNPFSINYALELDAVRQEGDGPLVIDLVIENRPGRVIIDGCKESGYRSGLEMIDGKILAAREGPGVTKGQLIPKDAPAHISIVQATELIVGTIESGGKLNRFLCWNGNASLGQSNDWKVNPLWRRSRTGDMNLTIQSADTRWSFRNVKLTPLFIKSPVASAPSLSPPVVPPGVPAPALSAPLSGSRIMTPSPGGRRTEVKRLEKTDLLTAVPRTVVTGEFGPKEGMKGLVSAGGDRDGIEFQIHPPDEYTLRATFTRLKGNDAIFLGIPLGPHASAVVIDRFIEGRVSSKASGYFSGLARVNDRELYDSVYRDVVKGPLLTNGKRATLRVIARKHSITVDLDGRRIVQWSGERYRLGVPGEYELGNGRNLTLGTLGGSSYQVESLELSEVEVVGVSNPGTPLSFDIGASLDLLKTARVDGGNGAWLLGKEKLYTTDSGEQWARFDFVPSGEFILEAEVTRIKGKDGLLFGITMDGHPCAVSLDCFADEGTGPLSGLELIAGQGIGQPGQPATFAGSLFTNDRPAKVKVIVLKNELILQCDDSEKFRWQGDPSHLSRGKQTLSNAKSYLAIGTRNSAYQIENLKYSPIIGAGKNSLALSSKDPPGAIASPKEPPPTSPPPLPRSPVPNDAELTAARAKLKESFGDVASKSKKLDEKLKLVDELREIALAEKDAAVRYALLDAARKLAMGSQDIAKALSIVEEISRQFETGLLDEQLQTLKLASGTTMPATAWEEAGGAALALAETARDVGRIEVADAASLLAIDFASRGKSLEQRKQVKAMRDALLAHRKSAAAAAAAEETLKSNPDDPAANLTVGKWKCFVLGDWTQGLPHLEKCSDPALADAANTEAELKGSLAIADTWYSATEKLVGVERIAALKRAQQAYARAAKELTGLEQLRAARREQEVGELLTGDKSPPTAKSKRASTEPLKPGLMVRLVYGDKHIPSPILGIIHDSDDFHQSLDTRPVESALNELDIDKSKLFLVGMGYVELEAAETVAFFLANADCFVDGEKIVSRPDASRGKAEIRGITVDKALKKGRHSVRIAAASPQGGQMEFSIRLARTNESCIFHAHSELEAELARQIALPNGGASKGALLIHPRKELE
jgi:hypothetical protein